MNRKLSHHLFGAAACVAVMALAGCETTPPPVAVVAAPPVAPPLTLAPRIVELASAYQQYVREASNISPAFVDGTQVQSALRRSVAYEPRQLAAGQIAYASIVALQEPTFIASVRQFAADPRTRIQIRDALIRDPAYVIGFEGSNRAAGLAIAALNGEGARVRGVGELVKQAAYDVQHQAWSKTKILAPEMRLAEAKTLSTLAIQATPQETARLGSAALGTTPLGLTGQPAPPPYTSTVVRGLAIAALAALGEGGIENAAAVEALTLEPRGDNCLRMSKLNLYQCLSVARPWYEDVFCLGQHVLIDTGQCIAETAGNPPLAVPTLMPATSPAPLQTPLPTNLAPVTATSTAGPAPVALSAEAVARPAVAFEP